MTSGVMEETRRASMIVDADTIQERFDRSPFLVKHNLQGHPLFALERILELARTLPADRVEYNAGDLPITQDPTKTPRNGLSVEETIQRIAECRSWLVLKNVECDPDYRQVLDECLSSLATFVPSMRGQEAFLFVSSPGSVTPFHIDPECNFLLQVQGTKTIRMFPRDDRRLLTEEELERFYAGASRNLVCRDEQGDSAWTFELTPGTGLHFPVVFPHWVKNGSEVSISFSVTFRTDESDRREILYRMNHYLRRLGLQPKPVGHSKWRDDVKFALFDTARKARRILGGGEAKTVKY